MTEAVLKTPLYQIKPTSNVADLFKGSALDKRYAVFHKTKTSSEFEPPDCLVHSCNELMQGAGFTDLWDYHQRTKKKKKKTSNAVEQYATIAGMQISEKPCAIAYVAKRFVRVS